MAIQPPQQQQQQPTAAQPFGAPVSLLGPVPSGPPPLWPPVARNARMIVLFNRGRVTRERLLHVTTQAILRCRDDWQAALICLDSLAHHARDPANGARVGPDRVVINAAVRACARAGRWPEALGLFNRMLASGICPDSRTYTLAITACRRGGNPADALGLFWHLQTFASRVGVQPTIHTLTTVISALGAAGHPDIAITLFGHLLAHGGLPGQRATPRTGHAVLEVCARAGKQADALAVLRLLEAAPAHAGLAPDGRSYMHAMSACDASTAQALLERAVANGVFQASLGFDGRRNLLDLRQGAILLGDVHAQDECDVEPALAAAIVQRLTAQGAIEADTVFVSSATGAGGLPAGVRERLARADRAH